MAEMQITDEMIEAAAKALFDRKEAQKTNANLRWVWEEFADASDAKMFWRGEARTALSAALSGMAEPTALKRAVNNLVSVALDYGRDFNDADSDERILLNAKFEAATEDVNAFFSAPPASGLREENERLRKALEPFADIANLIEAEMEGLAEDDTCNLMFHDYLMERFAVHEFFEARAALNPEGK